ncbi:vacuolar sorting-associated protein [Histoplasma capsulatum]|uniref:Vacuolar sorting-associated protein n=1 Tax=Ajellomyces capsulatus TaxID=5037 RepID=A0A8A1LZB5_AJECA|nr:vacuolar sorting-associated protein [Histoplasma capsulatum]
MSSPEPRDCIPGGDGPQQESQQLGSDIIGERTEYPKADGSTPKTSPFSSNYENIPLGLSPNTMMEAERKETDDNDTETVGMAGTSATAGSFGPNHDLINMNTSAQNIERLAVSCRESGSTQSLALNIDVASTSPSSPQAEKPYLDPTPKTPQVPQSPLGMPTDYTDKDLPQIPADIACDEDVDKPAKLEAQNDEDSQSEIQSIMDQFTDDTKHPGPGELTSPRLELAEQFLPGQAHFPPRKSSLEPIVSPRSPIETHVSNQWQSRPSSIRSIGSQIISPPAVPPKSPSTNSQNPAGTELAASSNSASRPPPPEPEPDQPFDFHRFLEQLRHRTADPVAKAFEDQGLSCSQRQGHMCFELLQSDIWYGISSLLRNAPNGDTSADSFVPLLIYVVLKANPEHLVSNIQYILRFRNQEKLAGEAGYYLSSLSGAIQFIETLDRTSLTISDEEFERNVEAAVSAIAERSEEAAGPPLLQPEKSTLSEPEVTPRNSTEGESYAKRKDSYQFGSSEDNVAVAGLLRTIQKPLSTIGRIFSEESPHPVTQQRTAPQNLLNTQQTDEVRRSTERQRRREDITPQQISKLDAQEAAARQASAEAAEARRIQRAEHVNVVETLSGMFPNLDKDLIDDVVRMKEGRVGLAVDACLALSAE